MTITMPEGSYPIEQEQEWQRCFPHLEISVAVHLSCLESVFIFSCPSLLSFLVCYLVIVLGLSWDCLVIVLSCLVVSYRIVSCRILYCLALPSLVLSCPLLSCLDVLACPCAVLRLNCAVLFCLLCVCVCVCCGVKCSVV